MSIGVVFLFFPDTFKITLLSFILAISLQDKGWMSFYLFCLVYFALHMPEDTCTVSVLKKKIQTHLFSSLCSWFLFSLSGMPKIEKYLARIKSANLLRCIRKLRSQNKPLPPKLKTERSIWRITAYGSRSGGTETTNGASTGIGKLKLQLMNCWGLSLDKFESKNSRGTHYYRGKQTFGNFTSRNP